MTPDGGPETLPLFGEPVQPGSLTEQVVPPAHPDRKPVVSAPLTGALVADPFAHAAEIERFYGRVVFGP